MSKQLERIDDELREWIAAQKIFFVGTAPLSTKGHINISPKGGDSFRVLGPMEVIYQDYTGSGAETAAHLRENGRIIVMFCGFEGKPRIARLHGAGRVIVPGDDSFEKFEKIFPASAGTRAFVHISVERVSTSCGYSAPLFQYLSDRDVLEEWAQKQGPERLKDYRKKKNSLSIDGLPAFGL